MIIQLFRRILKLDENDRKIEEIKSKTSSQIDRTTLVLKEAGKLRNVMVRKTTTYYLGKSLGVIIK